VSRAPDAVGRLIFRLFISQGTVNVIRAYRYICLLLLNQFEDEVCFMKLKDMAIFGCLLILCILGAGVCGLAIMLDELGEEFKFNLNLPHLSFLKDRDTKGDEFTGQASAWIFGLASLPVVIDLTAKFVTRRKNLSAKLKAAIQQLNLRQRKYLMPWHTYLSIAALGFGFLHLFLSSCPAVFLPELGLAMMTIMVVSGLVIKVKIGPISWRKILCKFHLSLVVSGIVVMTLFLSHVILD
jgi:hypothetical protein